MRRTRYETTPRYSQRGAWLGWIYTQIRPFGSRQIRARLPSRAVCHRCQCAAMPLFLVVLGCVGCQRTPATRQASAANAGYLQLVSLSENADQQHTVAASDTAGKTWFFDPTPGLTLGQCEYERVGIGQASGGKWEVMLSVRSELDKFNLRRWTTDRLGTEAGVILGDRLILVAKLSSPLQDLIAIPAFSSESEARAEAEIIRNGGTAPGLQARK